MNNDINYKLAVDCINCAAELVRCAAVLLSGVSPDMSDLCKTLYQTAENGQSDTAH